MREKELAAVVKEYQRLPQAVRKPQLEDPSKATPPKRAVPKPPPDGLIVRGFCTYLRRDDTGKTVRSKEYYYKENPDRWAAETQSDMLWLTKAEWKSLVPTEPKHGDRSQVSKSIQQRFFSTIGIDYMEGGVNSLVPRKTSMTLTVERVTPDAIAMRLDGYGSMGKPLSEKLRNEPRSRGCEVRVVGYLNYSMRKKKFDRFDVVGLGEAWGDRMNREIRIGRYPWMYGIACELVKGDEPIDLIPPYNLFHFGYGSAESYFGKLDDNPTSNAAASREQLTVSVTPKVEESPSPQQVVLLIAEESESVTEIPPVDDRGEAATIPAPPPDRPEQAFRRFIKPFWRFIKPFFGGIILTTVVMLSCVALRRRLAR